MKHLLLLLACIPWLCYSQEISTINVTPFSQTPIRYNKVVASPDGKDVFLFGKKGKQIVVMQKDGNYWRDISNNYPFTDDVDDITSQNESTVWVLNNGTMFSLLCVWSSKYGWSDYKIKDEVHGRINALGTAKNGELLIAGKKSAAKGTDYPIRHEKSGWKKLMPKKTQQEMVQLFQSCAVSKITGGIKDMVYMELRNDNYQSVIVYWNGKQWNQAGDALKDSAHSMIADDLGNILLSGNFKTADNKDCILKWDGKKWLEIPVDGFVQNKPKTLAMDKSNQLLVGGETVDGYAVKQWDGNNGWLAFGIAPASINTMAFNGTDVFVIAANGEQVYSIPKGGSITAVTNEWQGEKKDKKAQEIYDFYLGYTALAPSYLDQVLEEWVSFGEDVNKASGEMLQESANSANYSFFSIYKDSLSKFGLMQGDNVFADYMKQLISSHYWLVSAISDVGRYAQNMYYNKTDWQKDKEYVNSRLQQTTTFTKQLEPTVKAYTKRNGIALQDAVAVVLTPDAKTKELWKLYNDFIEDYKKVDQIVDQTFKQITSLSADAMMIAFKPEKSSQRDLIKRLSNECTNETIVLTKYRTKLAQSSSSLQPAAASFAQAFDNYFKERQSLLDVLSELADYLTNSRFTNEQDARNYLTVCASKAKYMVTRYKQFKRMPTVQKAASKFQSKFGL